MRTSLSRFWFPRPHPLTLSAMRISFAGMVAWQLLSAFPGSLDRYFGPYGLFAAEDFPAASVGRWSPFRFLDGPGFAIAWHLEILALGLLAAGYHVRAMLTLSWVFHVGMLRIGQALHWQIYSLISIAHVCLWLVPWPPSPTRRSTSPGAPGLRMLQVQLSLVYAASALEKLGESGWRTGAAMADLTGSWVMTHPILLDPGLSALLSWGLVSFEFLLAATLWIPRAQGWAAGSALIFHGLVSVFTEIRIFSALMVWCHASYAYPMLERAVRRGSKIQWPRVGATGARRLGVLETFDDSSGCPPLDTPNSDGPMVISRVSPASVRGNFPTT